jgi:hypothetical protein
MNKNRQLSNECRGQMSLLSRQDFLAGGQFALLRCNFVRHCPVKVFYSEYQGLSAF